MEAGMGAHRSSSGGNHSPQGGGLCWQQPASKGAAMLAAGARQGFPCASGIPAPTKVTPRSVEARAQHPAGHQLIFGSIMFSNQL